MGRPMGRMGRMGRGLLTNISAPMAASPIAGPKAALLRRFALGCLIASLRGLHGNRAQFSTTTTVRLFPRDGIGGARLAEVVREAMVERFGAGLAKVLGK